MNHFGHGPKEATELRGAWQDWQALVRHAQRFMDIPAVRRAFQDDRYRLGAFKDHWHNPPGGTGTYELAKRHGGSQFSGYDDVAEAYHRAANNTQKLLDRKNSPCGMRAMTVIQEKMNLLLHGSTLHSVYETAGLVIVPDTVQTIEGLRIHAVLALKLLLSSTTGGLDETIPDVLVTHSLGLHAIVSHEKPHIQQRIPRVNQIGSRDELERGYAYGNVRGKDLSDRLQGARFRAEELREQAEEVLPDLAKAQAWTRPGNSVGTLLTTEVCTARTCATTQPVFFRGQWGLGPVAPPGESIDFNRGDIRGQILKAAPHIARTILHYPTDNPVTR